MYDEKLINSWEVYVKNKYLNKKQKKQFSTTQTQPPVFNINYYYNKHNKSSKDISITKEFVRKYCCNADKNIRITKDEKTIIKQWNEFNEYLVRKDINWFAVARYLCRYFEYKEFLKLPYWIITRNKVAYDKYFSCQLFNNHDNHNIVVHHNTYLFHGFEAHTLNTLIVLCESCHLKHHKNIEVNFSTIKNTFYIYKYGNIVQNLNKNSINVNADNINITDINAININNIKANSVTSTADVNAVINIINDINHLVDFKSDFHKAVYESELVRLKSQKLVNLNKKVYKNHHI